MEFIKSRVYTALNAGELKLGSIIVVADNLENLERKVENSELTTLVSIEGKEWNGRFYDGCTHWHLAYLVDEPEPLKWTDLKIGDIIKSGEFYEMVTGIHKNEDTDKHIFIQGHWISDTQLAEWEIVK